MDAIATSASPRIHIAGWLSLSAEPGSVKAARRRVISVLACWGMPADLMDVAGLLVSELAANAILHGQSGVGGLAVRVQRYGCCLAVEVRDSGRGVPVVRHAAEDAESGRGMQLVASLANSWGYYFSGGRKHVWFHLRLAGAQLAVAP